MASVAIRLSTSQQNCLDNMTDKLKQFVWETGEYIFHDFIEYFQLPQIIRIAQPWDTNFAKGDLLFLQSSYERHLLTAKSLTSDNKIYIIPDWFQGQCRILTTNPTYRSRWWEFKNATELQRFNMPRQHIRLLQNTPVHMLLPSDQIMPVLLRKNVEITLKRIEKSSTITNNREMFVLADKNNQEFLLDPFLTPFQFATQILGNEFDPAYYRQTTENLFTLPEIMMRYELPLEIEIVSQLETITLPDFPNRLHLDKYCVAKSVLAFSIGESNQPRLLEMSPLIQFSIQCVKCLTIGLPRDGSIQEAARPFDENAYRYYKSVREQFVRFFEDIALQYMRMPTIGNHDEVECIEKVHDIGLQLKTIEMEQSYLTLDEADNYKDQSLQHLPTINQHPTRFTVHLPADTSNPYSNVLEVDDGDDETPT